MLTYADSVCREDPQGAACQGTHFTHCTGTNVQILTRQKALLDLGGYGLVGRPLSRDGRLESEDWRRAAHTSSSVGVYLLYWYKCLLAFLVLSRLESEDWRRATHAPSAVAAHTPSSVGVYLLYWYKCLLALLVLSCAHTFLINFAHSFLSSAVCPSPRG